MEKRRYGQIIVGLVILFAMMMACNVSVQGSGNEADQTVTAVVGAFFAQMTQTAQFSALAAPSATSSPTVTQTLTSTPTATPASLSCNRAQFIADVKTPDYTAFYPGAYFYRTWRLMNAGTCAWTSAYQLIFTGGDSMSAPAVVGLTNAIIPPGGTVDASVMLIAPGYVGTYQASFNLRAPDGSIFGIGDNGINSLWARIKVKWFPQTYTPSPAPTETPIDHNRRRPGMEHPRGFWNFPGFPGNPPGGPGGGPPGPPHPFLTPGATRSPHPIWTPRASRSPHPFGPPGGIVPAPGTPEGALPAAALESAEETLPPPIESQEEAPPAPPIETPQDTLPLPPTSTPNPDLVVQPAPSSTPEPLITPSLTPGS